MTPHQREVAIDRIKAAMFQVGLASEDLRAKSYQGKHRPSPAEHYELNRIWVDLDALRKKLEAGGR